MRMRLFALFRVAAVIVASVYAYHDTDSMALVSLLAYLVLTTELLWYWVGRLTRLQTSHLSSTAGIISLLGEIAGAFDSFFKGGPKQPPPETRH